MPWRRGAAGGPHFGGGVLRCWYGVRAVLVLLGLPFASTPGRHIPGFTVAWLTLVLVCDLTTAALLVGMSRNGVGPRPLLLAMAFLWSGAFA